MLRYWARKSEAACSRCSGLDVLGPYHSCRVDAAGEKDPKSKPDPNPKPQTLLPAPQTLNLAPRSQNLSPLSEPPWCPCLPHGAHASPMVPTPPLRPPPNLWFAERNVDQVHDVVGSNAALAWLVGIAKVA